MNCKFENSKLEKKKTKRQREITKLNEINDRRVHDRLSPHLL